MNLYKLLNIAGIKVNPPLKGEVNIIDISAFTGYVDFNKLAPHLRGELEPRIHGAIIRMSDGKYVDKYCYYNYEGFRSYDIPVGGYGVHYIKALEFENVAQADALIKAVNGLGEYPLLGVYGDWERNPDKLGYISVRKAIKQYIQRYESNFGNNKLGIYTNSWWDYNVANKLTGASEFPPDRVSWFASYYATKPYIPWDWKHRWGDNCWILWQYDNRFRFPGIPGSVDMNTFNGNLEEFLDYFGLQNQEPPGEVEMKYRVVIDNLRIREKPDINSKILGTRNLNDIVIPLDTIGDNLYSKSYWVKDERGWSAAQWKGSIYMQTFI